MGKIHVHAEFILTLSIDSNGERMEKHTNSGLVAQWITRLTTDQKIPGSNPGKVEFFCPCILT